MKVMWRLNVKWDTLQSVLTERSWRQCDGKFLSGAVCKCLLRKQCVGKLNTHLWWRWCGGKLRSEKHSNMSWQSIGDGNAKVSATPTCYEGCVEAYCSETSCNKSSQACDESNAEVSPDNYENGNAKVYCREIVHAKVNVMKTVRG